VTKGALTTVTLREPLGDKGRLTTVTLLEIRFDETHSLERRAPPQNAVRLRLSKPGWEHDCWFILQTK